MSTDELFVPLDENIIQSAAEALESGQTHYVDVPGIAPLRAALAQDLNSAHGTAYQQTNLIVTAGMQESRFLTIQMVGERFDRIAIPRVVHPGAAKAIGVRPMPVDLIDVDPVTLLPTVDAVRRVLAAGTRFLYLESPSRLTGAAYPAETVAALAALFREYKATVIWDQGLAAWTSDYSSLASQADLSEQVLLIGDAFPGMGFASWFIGYIAAPQALIPAMQSQKQIMAICTSTPTQYAALEASKSYRERRNQHIQQLGEKRRKLVELLKGSQAESIDGAAVTVLAIRLSPESRARVLAQLSEIGATVADGADFGAPDVLRLTVSYSGAVETAVKRVR